MKKLLIVTIALAATLSTRAGSTAPGIEKYVDYNDRPVEVAAPQYSPDGTCTLRLVDGKKIVKVETRTGKETETIFDVATTRETSVPDIQGFTMSPDGSKILVWRDKKPIYRRSFTASYYVYEIRSRLMAPLSQAHTPQRAPLFSPDGRMVAFTASDNNIYLRKLDYNTEVAVTTDGHVNEIINGVPDWTYEEEFSTTMSMAWAPDNLTLCYLKYNESDVPVYHLALYSGSCDPSPEYALYPGTMSYKYPVAGEPNSKVSLHSYDIETRKTKTVDLGSSIEYIPRIMYGADSDCLLAVALNRAQTRMDIFAVNPKSTVVRTLLTEQSQAWLDPLCYESVTAGAQGIVIFSSRTGYSHLYQYSYTGQLTRTITRGDYDVTAYYGYDSASGRHFYQAASTGAINRVVCSVDSKGTVKTLTPAEGTASAWLSPTGDWLTVRYSSVEQVPTFTLWSTRGDKQVRILEDNSAYAATHPMDAVKEFFTFRTLDGVDLNGYIVKGRNMEPGKRYPAIMYQYSGPGSQEVVNRWDRGWMNYYANNGFVIVCVDGRGTGGRGRKFMDVVYKNLGYYETIDQTAAARYAASLPYVDPGKIGIFGWSYGGYETLMALTTGEFDYACGVAVAPVTDWRYYDTVYAERYMLTPRENEEGYRTSAPVNHVDRLDCPLLIMYGTADDNVHPANSIEYLSALEGAGKWCDLLTFPNMNHSIFGCNSREVLYSRMFSYFKEKMK